MSLAPIWSISFLSALSLLLLANLQADQVAIGSGSYSTQRPESCQALPVKIYKSDFLAKRATPTNQWWSSLVWKPLSQPLFAHPLTFRCQEDGFAISNPGIGITGAGGHVMGGGFPKGGDLMVGLEGITFTEANWAGSSDWFVTAESRHEEGSLRTHFGHGSPFVFFEIQKANALLRFGVKPQIWQGSANSPALGVTIRGSHYGIFGAKSSRWTKNNEQEWGYESEQDYLTLALLPDNSKETFTRFSSVAHNHIVDTRVQFMQKNGHVEAKYSFSFDSKEPGAEGTLFALYPHQWKYSADELTEWTYRSVRGEMKVRAGSQFTTRIPIQGVLPVLPKEGIPDQARMLTYLKEEVAKLNSEFKDTYWEGKDLGKYANLTGIAEQVGATEIKERFLKEMKGRLENWFQADAGESAPLFYYDRNWGTLIGSRPSYGSDSQLNDHHFHYGYFIRAAAEIARHDPAWARKWQPFVDLIIRDIASHDRHDPLFPYIRCFDLYAGHSWASGHADFGDGNNQESSSESLNAWYSIMLWGAAIGDKALHDKGLYLFNTERVSVEEYWFDVTESNFPEKYPHVALGMVWGGKGSFSTWFSGEIDCIHGINWLPFTPASLYMGRFPNYVEKNFERIVEQRTGGKDFETGWGDLVVMFGALHDPAFGANYINTHPQCKLEGGNTHAFMYHWCHTLNTLGRNDASVTSSHPFTNIYLKDGKKTYAAYNFGKEVLKVTFSDGFTMEAKPRALSLKK